MGKNGSEEKPIDQLRPNSIKLGLIEPSEPLWKRAPSRDNEGRAVSDFRMHIRGLKKRPHPEIQSRIELIQQVLSRYRDSVVFADLNLKINVLWVSLRADARLDMDVAAEIHDRIPEAKLLTAYPYWENFSRRS